MANRYPLIVDSSTQQIKEFPSGDTLVIDNLQVTGTTTTLETATLNVEDKNITVNYSTGDSSSTADGSGLTFQDAVDASNDATILWNATNDEFDFSHGITLPDSQKITFGAGSDLQIYHDGSNSYIEDAGTGNVILKGANIEITTGAGNKYFQGAANIARLYHTNNEKLATTSTGIDVTGNATFDDNGKAIFGAGSDLEIYHDGSDSIINEAGTGVLKVRGSAGIYIQKYDGTENLASFLHDDGVYLYDGANNIRLQTTSTGIDVTGNATFDDNGKAIFGAGSDLQIYHDGSHSRLVDSGTGNFIIQAGEFRVNTSDDGEAMIKGNENGNVELYYDASKKLETTSTGVTVTGALLEDSNRVATNGRAIAFSLIFG